FRRTRRTHYGSTVLLGRGLRHRKDRDEYAAFGFGIELNTTIGQSEQRMILAYTDVLACMPLRPALARENIAGEHALAAEQLETKPLARRVAAVSRRSACFLVSHNAVPKSLSLYSDSVTESSHKY